MSRRLRIAFASAGSYTLAAAAGAFALTGQAAGLDYSSIPAEPAGAPAPLTLTSGVTGTVPFTAGYAIRQGDVPSGSGIAITGATAQATVKNTWPDGSAKFAIIAGTYASTAGTAAELTVAAGTASTGTALTTTDLQAALTQPVSVDAGAFGSASWSGADWASPFETWVSGHRMSSWVYRKQIGTDDHLVAWLEVRLYAGGEVEILPWVENGYLLVAGPTSKSATYTFTMGGTPRFSAVIDIPHHCRTPLISGTATAHWLGTDHGVVALHDTDYLQATGLVPAYSAKTPPGAATVAALPASFTPMQRGSWPTSIGGGGGKDHVGPLPLWDTLYLTCPQASTAKAVEFNAYFIGGTAIHYREDPTFATVGDRGKHLRLSNRATWDNATLPAASGTAAPIGYDSYHQPQAGYLAYLMTGRRYHLDTVQFLTTFDTLLSMRYSQRDSGLGTLKTNMWWSVRGAAWGWRALGLAAAMVPDATYSAEYKTQLQNNIDHYWTKYVGAGGWSSPVGNTQGLLHPYGSYLANLNGASTGTPTTTTVQIAGTSITYGNSPDGQFVGWDLYSFELGESRPITAYAASTNTFTVSPAFSSAPTSGTIFQVGDGNWWHSPWMNDYFVLAVGWVRDLGIDLDATQGARLAAFFDWLAQSVVGRLGGTGATEYLYRDAAPYVIPIAKFDYGDTGWDTGTGPWFANWREIHDATYGSQKLNDGADSPWPYAPRPSVEGNLRNTDLLVYDGNVVPMFAAAAYALKHNAPGAEAAYRRLTTAGNWPEVTALLDTYPMWAVTSSALPKWRRGQAINQWREILGTASADAPATHTAYQRRYLGTVSTGATTTVIPMQAGGFAEYGTPTDDFCVGFPLVIGGESRNVASFVAATNTFTVVSAYSSAPTNGTAAAMNGQASAGPARLDPYCGMTVDTRRSEIWQLANGGHGDYYGNEVVKIDLMADEPAWAEWMVGSSGYVINDNLFNAPHISGNAWYDDDGINGPLPCSQHSYYCTQFIERHGRAVRFGGGSISASGTAFVDVESFDADVAQGVNGWDARFTYRAAAVAGYTGLYSGGSTIIRPPVCRDPRTDHVYTMSPAGFYEFTPSVAGPSGADTGGTWAGMVGGVANGAGTGDATAIDTIRGRMLMAGGTTLTYWVYDIDGGTGWTSGTFTGSAASSISGGVVYEGWGLTFVPEIDAYLMRNGAAGGTVLRIDAATFEVTDLGATGGGSIPATAARSVATEHVYNKFQYVPKLRGVVYAPANGANLWFLRTH